jgi:predicted nucleotidyltransferase component of viral defense system
MSVESLLNRYKDIHEGYMKQILVGIFSWPYKDSIGFKGGTLAYLQYWLPRFSTDIDLDLIDPTQEQEIKEYIENLLIWFWDVENRLWKDLHRWRFRYDNDGRIIKIELNKRHSPFTRYEWITIDGVKIKAQTLSSMITNKLLALGSRRYNRDLYDIHFFLSKWYEFDEHIIVDKTNQTIKQWISMIIEEIPISFQENTILHQLWEVLDDKQKPRVKTHLANETINLLQLYLNTH